MSDKWIYDLETYPNIFTFSIVRADGKFQKTFEISFRKNELDKIFKCLDYLIEKDHYLVGFNNLGFDYPILHGLLDMRDRKTIPVKGITIAGRLYQLAQKQIESFKSQFPNTVRESERLIKQIDLFKIHHFDNKAKSTSLKMLEFNMRENNIEDLPYPVGTDLKWDECDVLVKYNEHDVAMTRVFYENSLPLISFREQLTHKYGRDFMNHNDTKIGKDYFIMRLEEANIPVYKVVDGKKVVNQTIRKNIQLKDCLFNYYDFKRPEFIAIHNWFGKQTITETKGVFSEIPEHLLGDVAKYAEMVVSKKRFKTEPDRTAYNDFKKQYPMGWIDKVMLKAKKAGQPTYSYWGCWNMAETLNVVVDGFRFDFGVGGIHGSLSNKVARQTRSYDLIDADVSSMYPNLAITNNVYPKHLTAKFCAIYKDVYEQRKSFDKKSAENAMMKLALNGVYGDSNNKFSAFYDSQFTMSITVNGQLSLCLLAEQLLNIRNLKLIQANTDGLTVALPKGSREEYDSVCKSWESQVGLQLEFAEYEKMFIRDVNNYLALYKDGKTKNKGAYEYENLGWHKNQSSLVIPMAAVEYMLNGTPIAKFIMSHNNKFDFMLRTKVNRSSRLVLVVDGEDVPQQNICRYYPSKSGGKLVKIMPPIKEGDPERRLGIDTSWNVKTCNNMDDFQDDIDYAYYIEEANKLVIETNKESK